MKVDQSQADTENQVTELFTCGKHFIIITYANGLCAAFNRSKIFLMIKFLSDQCDRIIKQKYPEGKDQERF